MAVGNSLIRLTRRGGQGAAAFVPAARISCSWEVNRAGLFSCFVDMDDLRLAGLPTDLRSWWLSYEHPLAGFWAGFVTASDFTSEGGIVLTGETWEALAKKRLLTVSSQNDIRFPSDEGRGGALLRNALNYASNFGRGPIYLDTTRISDTAGPVSAIEWDATMDLYDDVVPQLTEDLGWFWRVRATDRVVSYAAESGEVRNLTLVGGIHVADFTVSADLWTITNSASPLATFVRGAGENRELYDVVVDRVEDPVSLAKYQRLEAIRDVGRMSNVAAAREAATAWMARTNKRETALECTLVPVGTEWLNFREGDTVRIFLPYYGVRFSVVVMVRTFDADQGTMRIAGEGSEG